MTGPPSGVGSRSGPRTLFLDELAARVGAYQWCEHRLFELTGAWAPLAAEFPPAAVLLDRLSAEHAWHAELWHARRPLPSHLDGVLGDGPPDPLPAFFHELEVTVAASAGPMLGVVAVGVLARTVLPRMVVTYRSHLDCTRAETDGPEMRVLSFVLGDESAAWQDAESLVQHLLPGRPVGAVGAVTDACRRLERTLQAVPGGMLRWPGPREPVAPGRGS